MIQPQDSQRFRLRPANRPNGIPIRDRVIFLVLFFCFFLISSASRADNFDDVLAENPLRPFHPNYAAIDSDHGESRVQFLMSIQYDLAPFVLDAFRFGSYRFDGFHFAYDGLYDFDLWSRPSQPIVSRLQNPGLYFSFLSPNEKRLWNMDGMDFGWFHESDGQVIGKRAAYDALYAQVGQDANDSVSRGWDYWY